MAELTINDIKAICGISVTDTTDDTLITNALNIAYATVRAYIDWDSATDTYTERCYYDGQFWVSVRANDVSISHVYEVDGDGTETEIASSNYYAVGRARWQIKSSYPFVSNITRMFNGLTIKVLYTSASITYALKEIVKAVAVFEFYRMPKKENSITVTSRSSSDVIQAFRKPIDFYAEIDNQIRTLLLPAV